MFERLKKLFRPAKKEQPKAACMENEYRMVMDTAAVIKHNTLMNGVTSSRGEAMGFVQENILYLRDDHTFELSKELKSTKTSLLMKEGVSVKYRFFGSYTQNGNSVELSEAYRAAGHVSWGTISKFLDTGDGDYDSESSPGILSLYPTAFFVANCKNVPMKVCLNNAEHTFLIEEFEPVILSAQESGKVVRQERQMDDEAGLMKRPDFPPADRYALKDTFSRWNMKVGTCINPACVVPPYEEILAGQFSSATLENHLKPQYVLDWEKTRETGTVTVTFSDETIRLLDWCKNHQMPLRGHTLIWYMGTPEWLFHQNYEADASNVDRKTLIRRMEEFISAFFAALAQGGWDHNMYCIDVVNEAVVAPDQIRKCPWQEIIGDDYVWYAYSLARKYAPKHMKLCYNDFDLETKTDKVIELVRSLTDENGKLLVDIIGQQGHYGAYSNIDTLGEALRKISRETGCELQITELDVSISRQGTDEELKTQGRFYYDFVQQILKLRTEGIPITCVTLWGFADSLCWMSGGLLHIYDRKLTPKYAYYGMLGLREYAGFDGQSAETESAFVHLRFVCEKDPVRYIQLNPDGSYTDTTTGAVQTGTYHSEGNAEYMLIPAVGSYCKLTVYPDGNAERVESAGNVVHMVSACPEP